MFDKCIECPRIGESCVPNLWLLPFPELFKWCVKRQKYLKWSNQDWADDSKVPVGTINRLKAGDTDCKYSTMRSLAISVIGGTRNEFACTEQVEKELRQIERLSSVEKENEELKRRLDECREMNIFLKKENERKAKIIDKYLE
jgi:Mg2+ and Co2+ transporter CorA